MYEFEEGSFVRFRVEAGDESASSTSRERNEVLGELNSTGAAGHPMRGHGQVLALTAS
jgi:hypothetical protein